MMEQIPQSIPGEPPTDTPANFSSSNLPDADFAGIKLRQAHFKDSALRDANFQNTDLTDTDGIECAANRYFVCSDVGQQRERHDVDDKRTLGMFPAQGKG